MLEDFNSKPLAGDILLDKILWSIGEIFYPHKDKDHYIALELNKYPFFIQTKH